MGLFASARQMFDGRPGSPVEDWLRRHGVIGQQGGGMGALGTPSFNTAPFSFAGPLRTPAVAADPTQATWAGAGPILLSTHTVGKVAPTRQGMFGRRQTAKPLGGVDLQAALADNAKVAPGRAPKFNIADALPGVAGGREMAFFDTTYGVDGYTGPEQAAPVAAPNRKESLGRAGRAPLVDSPVARIAFNDELPETVASKLKPEQLALWKQVATDPKSTSEQLTSLMREFGYDLANADAIVAARDKGLGVNKNVVYKLREIPRNADGATGAAARGLGDPVNFLGDGRGRRYARCDWWPRKHLEL